MKKVTVSLEDKDEVVKMILDVFKGKTGASNLANIFEVKTDKCGKLYDSAFEKEIKKLKPDWFK